MNIFVVHNHPRKAARMLCDKHVVKMALESAQMLCTAINESGGQAPYKSTHKNHPCNVWARETLGNFLWLYDHGLMLCDEYYSRFKKKHKCRDVMLKCIELLRPEYGILITGYKRTPHPLCMPDEYKGDDVVASYRDFYNMEKCGFAEWKHTDPPDWWAW
jgi:regulator of replication initiation timing